MASVQITNTPSRTAPSAVCVFRENTPHPPRTRYSPGDTNRLCCVNSVRILRNNPQVVGEIRAENTHTTHVNTMKPISFWCSKLGCIFWLYSSVYIDLLHEKQYITCLIDATYKKESNAYINRKVITSTKKSNHRIGLKHSNDLFPNILLLSLVVSVDID
jgi:hypothetical protein